MYFASDFHLGAPTPVASAEREKKIVRWLQTIQSDAEAIFLVGDIFDFWFEYKHCIPKGHSRFLGELANLRDRGIPIYFFTGNHDMWMFDYFPTELGIPIIRNPTEIIVGEKRLLVGHGDGLGPGDATFKILKKVFANPIAQWLFEWIHPNVGMAIAHAWSQRSRKIGMQKTETFKGEQEWLWQYCKEVEKEKHFDLYIFGHRHLPLQLEVSENSQYINLGEWISQFSYFRYDGKKGELLTFS